MAQTQDGKKRVLVPGHRRAGVKVSPHYRTPPCPTKPTKK